MALDPALHRRATPATIETSLEACTMNKHSFTCSTGQVREALSRSLKGAIGRQWQDIPTLGHRKQQKAPSLRAVSRGSSKKRGQLHAQAYRSAPLSLSTHAQMCSAHAGLGLAPGCANLHSGNRGGTQQPTRFRLPNPLSSEASQRYGDAICKTTPNTVRPSLLLRLAARGTVLQCMLELLESPPQLCLQASSHRGDERSRGPVLV